MAGLQGLPRLTVPIRAGRADRLDHHPDQLVVDRINPGLAGQARGLRGLHIAARSLAVHPCTAGHHPQPLTLQPAPQHLTNLNHADLPESHPATSTSVNPDVTIKRTTHRPTPATRRVVP